MSTDVRFLHPNVWDFLVEGKMISATTAKRAVLHRSYSPLCAIRVHSVQGTDFEAVYSALNFCSALRPNCSRQHRLYISNPYKTEVKLWMCMFKLNVFTKITQR